MNTYTYGKHWSHFVHAVAIRPLTDIFDIFWDSRQFQLVVHKLGKSLHSIRTATNTHKLTERNQLIQWVLFYDW